MIYPQVKIEYDDKKKLEVMEECDYSFSLSVTHNSQFSQTAQKILTNAIFLKATDLVHEKEQCVGYAAMYANDTVSKIAYISLICVKKEYQGRHIGSMLINKCIELARNNSMERIKLEVLESNDKAIAFYKHHGFTFDAQSRTNTIFMKREI